MYNNIVNLIRSHYGTDEFIPLHEPRFSELDKEYVMDAIDSTFVSSVGAYVDRFEKELAQYIGAKYAVATVNGTAALQVSLELVGVNDGDEVITQPLTFVATANAIKYNRAHPVFVDVDRDTMGMSPASLKSFLEQHAEKRDGVLFNKSTGRKISAILPMHTFGHPCRIQEICTIANEWGISVVEDAAEAMGSYYNEQHCGTFGQVGVFSFNGNKTITCGGGGAIVTNDESIAKRAKHLTTTAKIPHAWEFVHDEVGYNFRMPNLNAALACAQLKQLEDLLKDKRDLAKEYGQFFAEINWADFISEPVGCKSNYWLNAILLEDKSSRDEFLKMSNNADVMTRPIWTLMNELEMYKECQRDDLKNARWLAERIVNLPSSARKLD